MSDVTTVCENIEATRPDYLGLSDIANQRGVTRTAVLQAIYRGQLKAVKISGRWLVAGTDAEEYIAIPLSGRGRRKG